MEDRRAQGRTQVTWSRERTAVGFTAPAALSRSVSRLIASRDAQYVADFPLALAIVRHHVALGDWKAVLRAREAYRTVSAAEVLALARKYFTPENCSVVTLLAAQR